MGLSAILMGGVGFIGLLVGRDRWEWPIVAQWACCPDGLGSNDSKNRYMYNRFGNGFVAIDI